MLLQWYFSNNNCKQFGRYKKKDVKDYGIKFKVSFEYLRITGVDLKC